MLSGAKSFGFSVGTTTKVFNFGPFPKGSFLKSFSVFGGGGKDDGAEANVTARVFVAPVALDENSDLNSQDVIQPALRIPISTSGAQFVFDVYRRLDRISYVAVEVVADVAATTTLTAGASVSVIPPRAPEGARQYGP